MKVGAQGCRFTSRPYVAPTPLCIFKFPSAVLSLSLFLSLTLSLSLSSFYCLATCPNVHKHVNTSMAGQVQEKALKDL